MQKNFQMYPSFLEKAFICPENCFQKVPVKNEIAVWGNHEIIKKYIRKKTPFQAENVHRVSV